MRLTDGIAPFTADENAATTIVEKSLDDNRVFVPYMGNYFIAQRVIFTLRDKYELVSREKKTGAAT
jgi:hypothetical protein